MADNNLTLLAAESIQVPQGDRVVVGNEERCIIGSTPLSTSSGLANIDLTQETLDEESRKKIKGKMR